MASRPTTTPFLLWNDWLRTTICCVGCERQNPFCHHICCCISGQISAPDNSHMSTVRMSVAGKAVCMRVRMLKISHTCTTSNLGVVKSASGQARTQEICIHTCVHPCKPTSKRHSNETKQLHGCRAIVSLAHDQVSQPGPDLYNHYLYLYRY